MSGHSCSPRSVAIECCCAPGHLVTDGGAPCKRSLHLPSIAPSSTPTPKLAHAAAGSPQSCRSCQAGTQRAAPLSPSAPPSLWVSVPPKHGSLSQENSPFPRGNRCRLRTPGAESCLRGRFSPAVVVLTLPQLEPTNPFFLLGVSDPLPKSCKMFHFLFYNRSPRASCVITAAELGCREGRDETAWERQTGRRAPRRGASQG